MSFCRGLLLIVSCLVLQSCATSSPTSAIICQELQYGKLKYAEGDFQEAFCHLLPVAAYGERQAAYAVGYMYYYGYGVSRDSVSGLFWMRKAADQFYSPAIKALNVIYFGNRPRCIPVSDTILHSEDMTLCCPTNLPMPCPPCSSMNPNAQPPEPCPKEPIVPCEKLRINELESIRCEPRPPCKVAPVPPPCHAVPVRPCQKIIRHDEVIESIKGIRKPCKVLPPLPPPPPLEPVLVPEVIKPLSDATKLSSKTYGLQIYGAYTLEMVKKIQKELNLQANCHIWRSTNQGKDWYVLTYGNFETAHDARLAIAKLNNKTQNLDPWVRELNGLEVV